MIIYCVKYQMNKLLKFILGQWINKGEVSESRVFSVDIMIIRIAK